METVRQILLAIALSCVCSAASAQEFADAVVLDVVIEQGFDGAYTTVTMQLGDLKIAARTYSVGGGVVYLQQHPEALIIGSTLQARLVKRGVLEVRMPEGKLVKLQAQRMERTP